VAREIFMMVRLRGSNLEKSILDMAFGASGKIGAIFSVATFSVVPRDFSSDSAFLLFFSFSITCNSFSSAVIFSSFPPLSIK